MNPRASLISVAVLDILVMVKMFPDVDLFILFKTILYLNSNITIDISPQRKFICYCCHSERLCEPESGTVMTQVELIAKCNPVM